MIYIELTPRQKQILAIVKEKGPITGEQIAEFLGLTRATIRPDLAILTMSGYLEARPRVGYFYAGDENRSLWLRRLRAIPVRAHHAPPVVVGEADSVREAIVRLFLEDVGTLYVLGRERLLAGVVSRKDLLRAAIGRQNLDEVPVGVIMTRMPNIVTVSPDDSVYDAAVKLLEYQVDSLPVVVPRGENRHALEVVGRFTKTTVTRVFVALGRDEPWVGGES
ncbi:helix-turn-helix transcriptional regulator [Hydrogenibacillus sp. N12]|uniref:helix-turn-helix transcriptional regulator n=1 Tax=Hydrogenibacillus sp. N12 TaxID=2866627 RepID=UPI001A001C9F|nr:helix-turn-helix transcriptional regulator [Hydrogenibacillus sp. N12]MBE3563028.1 helix-turn-helix transcriptional regulator [Hydrogenibacillus schlegelii]QZA32229.1 helix-turn-helix transcriptional regulator [Hydrogenibacillus sp. N12]